jgi:uncharacterized protein YcnI
MSLTLRRRTPVLVAVLVVALLAVAPAAWAHVSVSSPDATPGGFGKLVFRVPTESDSASTVKVTVTLPSDTPFAFVSARALSGWSVATTEKALAKPVQAEGFTLTKAVSTVTWTAGRGAGVAPGQFQEFELSVGPFPKGLGAIELPAEQGYSDGTVVRWDQPTPSSGDEPEHPVPTLALRPAAAPVDGHGTASSPDATGGIDRADGLARGLGGAGLALGIVAVAVAVRASRRRAA